MFRILANDASRNRRIAQDVLSAYQKGRKIIVLTERTDHLELLRKALSDEVEHCFILHGRLSKRQRTAIFAELAGLCDQAPRILIATGRLVGEGFDYPPLDTMVLAMPISWKGTLRQYAGRLHREYSFKQDVRIYDYVEHDQPRLARMWDKRQRGYRAMGYRIRSADEFDLGKPVKVKYRSLCFMPSFHGTFRVRDWELNRVGARFAPRFTKSKQNPKNAYGKKCNAPVFMRYIRRGTVILICHAS